MHHAQNIRQTISACYQGLGTKPHTVHIGHNNNTIHPENREVVTKTTGPDRCCVAVKTILCWVCLRSPRNTMIGESALYEVWKSELRAKKSQNFIAVRFVAACKMQLEEMWLAFQQEIRCRWAKCDFVKNPTCLHTQVRCCESTFKRRNSLCCTTESCFVQRNWFVNVWQTLYHFP